MPSDTVPSTGTDVCSSTTSGGKALPSSTGTSDSRLGKYRSPFRPRMPGPTNGDSSVTPSRSGTPSWAFSMNNWYCATALSSTASARHGVAKLPAATTRTGPGSAPSTAASRPSETIRTSTLSQRHARYEESTGAQGAYHAKTTTGSMPNLGGPWLQVPFSPPIPPR